MNESIKLLVIDDDHAILEVLSKYLQKHTAYRVVTADNGLDGVKLLGTEGNNFALVITDLMMEDIGGVGVIAISKKKFPEIPVIVITGGGPELQKLAHEKNADLVVEKPLSLSDLRQQIDRLISKTSRDQVQK